MISGLKSGGCSIWWFTRSIPGRKFFLRKLMANAADAMDRRRFER